MTGTLTPAYGRDYKSKADVCKAFLEGKDFMFNPPGLDPARLCNIRDYESGEKAVLRYDGLLKQTYCVVP